MQPYAIWLIVGVVTLILELLSGTMFLIWIALGCLLAAVAAGLVPGVVWVPWLVFVASTAILLWLGRKLASRIHGAATVPSNVDSLIGQTATVLETIDPVENTGRVRIGSDEWRARSDARFEEKEQVLVLAVEGTTLIVSAVESKTEQAAQNAGSE